MRGNNIRGSCRVCGGIVRKDWAGIKPEFHCEKCGLVTSYAGTYEKPDWSSEELANAIKEVMDEMSLDVINSTAVVNTLRKQCNSRPVIRRESLNAVGLEYDHRNLRIFRMV